MFGWPSGGQVAGVDGTTCRPPRKDLPSTTSRRGDAGLAAWSACAAANISICLGPLAAAASNNRGARLCTAPSAAAMHSLRIRTSHASASSQRLRRLTLER